MTAKTKTREITIVADSGAFNAFFSKLVGEKKDYDFEGISMLRKLLSNERARIIHLLKTKKPVSIYALAKLLGRDFKSVFDDIKLLEKFGFVDLVREENKGRERLRPVLIVDSMNIYLKL